MIILAYNEFITVHQEQVCFLAQLVRATVSITSDVRLGTRDVDTYDLLGLGMAPRERKGAERIRLHRKQYRGKDRGT